ncbi:MAG: alpha-(1-_3)-arabinofuranosyltransferase family protein [Ilumatobacteraceae bacterium]
MLSYLPPLASSPGHLAADTKAYLTLDPGRLLGDAAFSWDARQFGGWVPHQVIGYLWPSGPWFWLGSTLGAPMWVVHRLWLGTILFAAALGARWCAREFGLSRLAAVVAATAYLLTPFTLPYLSRGSILVLPWAGLGWLIALTARAARDGGWRWPAWFALVIVTVGGINATAMVMIAPGPLLVLFELVWRREVPARRAIAAGARIAGSSAVVSVWWLMGLAVQGRYGAPVLAFSETLQSVSFTAVSSEALRGAGYWITYVSDPTGPLTTGGLYLQSSVVVIAAGFAVVLAGLLGIVSSRWVWARWSAFMVLVGVVLASGVHPIDDPSPLMSPIASASRSTLALALRSSTRAVPLTVLGLALGAGALVDRPPLVGRIGMRRGAVGAVVRPVIAATVGLLALLGSPAFVHRLFVDPVLGLDQVPSAWYDAAAALDARPADYRTLQLPGTESAAHRFGQLVDPLLPGLTERPVLQRDWLPLGSAPLMDLFWALDGRFQAGTVEPDSIAPVARLLGADSIVLAGDTAAEKFDTPSPETTWSMFLAGAAGLGTPATYGVAIPNGRGAFLDVERIAGRDTGAPVPPVAIVPVEDPRPLVRATGASVIVAGSGDGLVDAAAAGLLPADAAVVYDASPGNPSLPGSDAVLLTDSARKRAHYWWGSQDVEGAVEPPTTTTVIDDPADSRLAVFPGVAPAQQTTMEIDGPFVARATGYGGPSSARPEDQPQYAIDGDPATAWRVADRADARGAVLRLESGTPQEFDTITIEQAESRTGGIPRHITEIELRTEDLRARVALDPGRTELALADSTSWVEIEIVQTDAGDRDQYAGYAPVGLAEVELGGVAPSPFGLRLPLLTDATATPDAVLVTRDRVDPLDRWRRDPETSLDRRWNSVAEARYEVRPTIRLSTATSPELVASILGIGDAATADTSLRGALDRSAWFAIDGDQSTAWSSDVGHTTGSSVTVRSIAGEVLDQLAVTTLVDSSHSLVRTLRIVSGGSERTVAIEGAGGRLPIEPLVLGDRTTFVVDASEDRIAIDRPSGAAVTLPVGITELGGHGLLNALVPDQFWSGCRSDLLAIDGSAVDVQVSGTVADALAGRPLTATPCLDRSDVLLPAGAHRITSAPGSLTGTTSIEWRWWDRSGRPCSPRCRLERIEPRTTHR